MPVYRHGHFDSETLCFLFFIFYFLFFWCDIHRVRSGYHNEKMKNKKRKRWLFILLPLEPGHSRNNCPSG
jgi:fumarate reductase subunit D